MKKAIAKSIATCNQDLGDGGGEVYRSVIFWANNETLIGNELLLVLRFGGRDAKYFGRVVMLLPSTHSGSTVVMLELSANWPLV